MKLYTLKYCEDLIDKYINKYNGCCEILEEGVLGLGTVMLYDAIGKKTIIIKEVFLNSWNSSHTIKMYNKMPKKYELILAENELILMLKQTL